MRDPRLLACNGRVAALELQGKVQAERFVEGWPQQVAGGLGNAPLADFAPLQPDVPAPAAAVAPPPSTAGGESAVWCSQGRERKWIAAYLLHDVRLA